MTPEQIEQLKKRYYQLDEETKALDVSQLAFKISANSFYGIMGLAHFRYYDYRMAEAVTSFGQIAIKKSKHILDDIFSKILDKNKDYVVYCDTDSAYVHIQDFINRYCNDKSDSEIVDYVEKFVVSVVQPQLNKKLSEFTKTFGIDDCKLDMKLECIGPSLIMCCHPDTIVETSNGKKTIESLWIDNTDDNFSNIDQLIIGFDMKRKNFYLNQTKTLMRRRYTGDLIRIETENGNVLKLTPNHPVLVRRNNVNFWVEAEFLKETDDVVEY